jgi:uncharacterized protein YbbC (DUF1343 family)
LAGERPFRWLVERVRPGIDVLCEKHLARLRGRRVGVLCHPASVTADLTHVVDRLVDCGVRLTRLFGPEHGVRGEAQDMIGVEGEVDRRTGIPVTSLYGSTFASLSPTPADLADVDVLLVDLQDVGSRYYTYVWTMALAMREAAKAGVEVLVLDRPNPLGGEQVEGGAVEPGFDSFVGLGSVPVRHGLTMGELARMVAAGMAWGPATFRAPLDLSLDVIPAEGWSRGMYFEDTALPWVLPSPNMPTPDTAVVYPGQCLLEGTNLSEGRGSTRPFEIAGAPFLDAVALARAMERQGVPGAILRPLSFRPTFHKHAGKSCGGVQIHVRDRRRFHAYRTGLAFLVAAREIAPEAFGWRQEPYEFVSHPIAIDLLNGTDRVRRDIDAGAHVEDLLTGMEAFRREFLATRAPFLLYGPA